MGTRGAGGSCPLTHRDTQTRRERMDGQSSLARGLTAAHNLQALRDKGLPGKSRTREIRELIPFNYWADKAALASRALLIHSSEPQRVGSSQRAVSK